jgi:hypothetical protein
MDSELMWKNLYEKYKSMNQPGISITTLFNLSFKEFKSFWGAFAELVRFARDKFTTPIQMRVYDTVPIVSDKQCKFSPHFMHEMAESGSEIMPDFFCIYCGETFMKTTKREDELKELFLLPYRDRAKFKKKEE